MLPWTTLAEWGQRVAIVTGLATPVYGGLSYLQLTPVTQSYVTEQIGSVKKDIAVSRSDTLDTKRVVMGLAKNDLIRERQAIENALKSEKEPVSRSTWGRRLENLNSEIERLDRGITKIDDKIEELNK